MHKIKKYLHGDGGAMKFFICLGVAIFSLLVVSLIMASVATFTDNPGGIIGILSLAAMLVSAVISGVAATKIKPNSSLLYAFAVAGSVIVLMLLCSVVMSGKISSAALMNYACYLGVFVLGSVLGKKKVARRSHRKI